MSSSLTSLDLKMFHQEKSPTKEASNETLQSQKSSIQPKYEWKFVWKNIITLSYLHVAALYGIYLAFTATMLKTILWGIFLHMFAGLGVTAGAHRLWTHRSYKAKWPMRFMLMIMQTSTFQNSIYEWARDHRVHHKFTDTNADPHNSTRGFFFSHVGWLLCRKHSDVTKKGATIDMTDLKKDPIVIWQKKLYPLLLLLFSFVLPVWIPCYFWNETLFISWHTNLLRCAITSNTTWLVNSAAHMWGYKPYDKNICPTENIIVAILSIGEGWHNYHHVFPWDYKVAEFGNYSTNFTTTFIDFCALLGLAYDMKTIPTDIIKRRAKRTGDGTRYSEDKDSQNHEDYHSHEDMKWGWGDVDMKPEEIQEVDIINKSD